MALSTDLKRERERDHNPSLNLILLSRLGMLDFPFLLLFTLLYIYRYIYVRVCNCLFFPFLVTLVSLAPDETRATHNPVFSLQDINVRDPAIWLGPQPPLKPEMMIDVQGSANVDSDSVSRGTYHVFFTCLKRNAKWKEMESWSIGRVYTRDWVSGGRRCRWMSPLLFTARNRSTWMDGWMDG